MEQCSEDAGREIVLRKLRGRPFRGFHYTPQDALVAAAPVPGGPAPPVRAKLDLPLPHRLYPAESGFSVKWPYEHDEFDPQHFQVKVGGWDHEHCQACNIRIGVGDEFWYTDDESTSFLCGSCYDRLCEIGNA